MDKNQKRCEMDSPSNSNAWCWISIVKHVQMCKKGTFDYGFIPKGAKSMEIEIIRIPEKLKSIARFL